MVSIRGRGKPAARRPRESFFFAFSPSLPRVSSSSFPPRTTRLNNPSAFRVGRTRAPLSSEGGGLVYRVYHEIVSEYRLYSLLSLSRACVCVLCVCAYVRTHWSVTDSEYEYGRERERGRVTTTCVRLVCVRNTEDERVSLERPGRTERWGVRQARVVARGTGLPPPGGATLRLSHPCRATYLPLTAPFALLPYRAQCRTPGWIFGSRYHTSLHELPSHLEFIPNVNMIATRYQTARGIGIFFNNLRTTKNVYAENNLLNVDLDVAIEL